MHHSPIKTAQRRFLIFYFLLLPSLLLSQNLLKKNGENFYLNGINMAWNNFGWDLGTHPLWGQGYDPLKFEDFFYNCENHGVNTARFWIHCDGRASPNFNPDGSVSGLDSVFFNNLDDVLDRAQAHNIHLILSLWSFDMLKDSVSAAGPMAGSHQPLIEDETILQSYINNALAPLIDRYKDHCAILAYEIINEPEWAMESSTFFSPISLSERVSDKNMRRFVARIASYIHNNTDQLVTLGSGSLEWNSTVYGLNHWSDDSLVAIDNDPMAFLDFYQIHWFTWMNWYPTGLNPYTHNFNFWKMNKPTIIGESPANQTAYNNTWMLEKAYENGWAGHLFWSYDGSDGKGNWDDCKSDILAFSNTHTETNNPNYCTPVKSYTIELNSNANIETSNWSISPNPTYGIFHINNSKNKSWNSCVIYSAQGQLIKTYPYTSNQINISNFGKGIYLLHLKNERGITVFETRLVILQ